jgi:hypothetical protein
VQFERSIIQIEKPIKQILIDGPEFWDNGGTRPWVRESFRKMIDCGTPALGWRTYASETEIRRVYHTCKVKSCPSCGYRAILQWQLEQEADLPNIPYSGVVFTMPRPFWHIFKENRDLLHDLPTLGGEAILQWMKDVYKVRPLILVVQHTFGRHLNFNAHLHVLVSAGGLSESEGRWIGKLGLNPVGLMKLWRHGLITYLRRASKAGLLKSDLKDWQFKRLLSKKYEIGWHVYTQAHVSKRHFLGYSARYIRRLPIAQYRFQKIDGPVIKFLTKDTETKEIVLDELPKDEFIRILAEHVPDKYRHSIRYYGLLAPRSKSRTFTILFKLLRQERRQRPPRMTWAEMMTKSFKKNPLIDSRGKPMQFVGQHFPTIA